MTDPHGWPDASKPGVPVNPERDGYHWLAAIDAGEPTGHTAVMFWFAGQGFYAIEAVPITQRRIAEHWAYLGPCLTPQEVAARVEAAAVAMRAICARAAMVELGWNNGSVEARKAIAMQAAHTVNAIRERPIPSSDALARIRADAEARGMERAAEIVEAHAAAAKKCSEEADVIHRIRAEYLAKAFALKTAAADVRAAAKERTA